MGAKAFCAARRPGLHRLRAVRTALPVRRHTHGAHGNSRISVRRNTRYTKAIMRCQNHTTTVPQAFIGQDHVALCARMISTMTTAAA